MKLYFVKLLIVSVAAILAVVSVGVSSVAAFDPLEQACESADEAGVCKNNQEGDNPLASGNGLLEQILTILFAIAGIAAVVMVVVGGFQFATSGGDPSKAAKGRSTLIYAIAGLVAVALSATIVRFMVNKLTG